MVLFNAGLTMDPNRWAEPGRFFNRCGFQFSHGYVAVLDVMMLPILDALPIDS
jgi:hypothetical protein